METEFSKQIRKIINDRLADSGYLDRYRENKPESLQKIADEILKYTGKLDYRCLYVEMCYKEMAWIDGVDLKDYEK